MDIDITPVNDVPVAAVNTVSTARKTTAYTFAAGDFTFTDVESDSSGLGHDHQPVSLAGGTLELSGVTVNNGDTIAGGADREPRLHPGGRRQRRPAGDL